MSAPPPITATIGLHGSASTFIFNITRELLEQAAGPGKLTSLYADQPEQLPSPTPDTLLIKSHHGSQTLDSWLVRHGARSILSIRDPRDAALSMALRFKAPLKDAVAWLVNDCNRILRVSGLGFPIFRYEQRFFERPEAVYAIAAHLGLRPPAADIEAIFNRYTTAQVRNFANNLTTLPPERLTKVNEWDMDRLTQILGPHIGDTKSGKYQGLPPELRGQITAIFRPFLDRFGYEL